MAHMGVEMKKITVISAVTLCIAGCVLVKPPKAHADYFNYPCNYPFQGGQVDVKFFVDAGGQYCDGPMEINGSHYHCESGGATLGGGGLGFAPVPGLPVNLGAFGGSGIGGTGGRCHFKCPDNTDAPIPNPPAAWVKHLVLEDKYNDCRDHMAPAGDTSTPQSPDSGPPEGAGKPVNPVPMP